MENVNVELLVKDYISLKEHEYKSIISKLKKAKYNYNSRIEYNTFKNYKDTHVILTYNYTNLLIREDKYFHTLNGKLIDINHFTRGKDLLLDNIKESIKNHLKGMHITHDMIDLVLSINKENYYVSEDGLIFIYSYNQFGIKSVDDFRIKVKYEDLYEHI